MTRRYAVVAASMLAGLAIDPTPAQAQIEGRLYQEESRPEVYLVEGGRRIWIPTPDALFAIGRGWNDVEVVPDGFLQALPRFDIPSTASTPGSLYYPPDPIRHHPLRAVPNAVLVHSRGKEVQLVQLQGWLRGVESGCGDGWDFHYGFELDTEWAEQEGIDLQAILRVGNIAMNGIALPGSHPRAAVSLPMIEIELDAAGRADRAPPGNVRPSDWNFERICDGETRVFPFDPFRPDGINTLEPLTPAFGARGSYVRVFGSLITDSPHDVQTRPNVFLSRWLAITTSDTAEWEGSVPDWSPGVNSAADNHYARWTEIHTLDRLEVLPSKESSYSVLGVALAARPSALPGGFARGVSCEQVAFELAPESPRPADHRVAWQELRGPETYLPWGEDADNGSWVSNLADRINVRAKVCGGPLGGSPGRFKALYRVWWEPQPSPPPPVSDCAADCGAERDDCMAEVAEPGGPRPQTCVEQYRACLRQCR